MSINCLKEHSETNTCSFNELFEIQEIQNAQDLFSKATCVSSIITDLNGIPLTKPSNFSKFCEVVRTTESGCLNCIKSDKSIGQLNVKGPTVTRCLSAGLLDAGVSIIVDGNHIANWLIGQIKNSDVDLLQIENYADQIGVDRNQLIQAFEEVPIMSTEQFENVAKMLYVFVNQLAEKAKLSCDLKNKLKKQTLLNDEISEQKKMLSITLDSITDGVITTNTNGIILNMNSKAVQFCGKSEDDLKGRKLSDVVKFDDSVKSNSLTDYLNEAMSGNSVLGPVVHKVTISEETKSYVISAKVSPVLSHSNIISGAVLVFSDITEIYEAEDKIKKNENRFRKLLDDIDAGVVLHDSNASVLFANPKAAKMFDLTTNQFLAKINANTDLSLFYESGEPMNREDYPVNKILRQKAPLRNHVLGVKKELKNEIVWIILNGDLILDEKGNIQEVLISFTDITERKKMEDILIKNEKYLNDTQFIAKLGSFNLDLENLTWTGTKVLKEILGISDEYTKTYDDWLAVIHPDWRTEVACCFDKEFLIQSGKFDKEYKIVRQIDGEERWVQCKGELIFEKNRPVNIIGTIQDIEERVETQKALKISEQKYREIFNNIQDVYFRIDMDGIVKEVSPSIKYFTDFNRNEIVNSHIIDLYKNPAEREILLKNIFEKGELTDYELDLVSKSKAVRNGSLNARLVKDSDGNLLCIEGTIRDITKRKQAEKSLRESENKFHDYIRFAPHGVFIANENGFYIEVNTTASIITGYSEQELLSINPADLIASESLEKFQNHFQRSVRLGYATDEFILIRKDGDRSYVNVDTVKLNSGRYLGFVVDITKRKVAEEALKTSENFLKETQIISQMGAYKVDFIAGSWELSDILKTMLGIGREFDNSMLKIVDLIVEEDQSRIIEYFENEVVGKKKKFDKKFKVSRLSDKKVLWLHVLGEVIYSSDNQPQMMIGTVQDITKRKTLSEALRKSEALYKSILNASPDAIIVTEINGEIRMISPAAGTLYGIEYDDQLIGENIFDFFDENDIELARQNCNLMFEEYIGTAEYQIKPIVGNKFYAEVNGDVIWGNDGHPTGMVFIVRDITDRKIAEIALQKSQEQIKKFAAHLQRAREEEKVMLAREIHDELGQILIALKIDMGLLKQNVLKYMKNNDNEDILTKFDNIFGTVDNTIKTTRKIMTDLRPEILYMVGLIDAIKFNISKFEERYKIKCKFENTENVNLEIEQSIALFRIFQEALTNIVKHSKATLVIVKLYVEQSKLFFEIKDNGIGFKKNQKIRIDSYGLIGMQERVNLLEGELELIGKPGIGTEIKVKIPYN